MAKSSGTTRYQGSRSSSAKNKTNAKLTASNGFEKESKNVISYIADSGDYGDITFKKGEYIASNVGPEGIKVFKTEAEAKKFVKSEVDKRETKLRDSIIDAINKDTSHSKEIDSYSYSKGELTVHSVEKGYGDSKTVTKSWTTKPKGTSSAGFYSDDKFAAKVFDAFNKKGITLKKVIAHFYYD